jgi:hypothetical protein
LESTVLGDEEIFKGFVEFGIGHVGVGVGKVDVVAVVEIAAGKFDELAVSYKSTFPGGVSLPS